MQKFFASEIGVVKEKYIASKKHNRLRRINEFFGTATSKLYCIFLVENLPIFLNANLMLQQEAPQIHVMSKRLDNVITDLFVRYVRPKSISNAKSIFDVSMRNDVTKRIEMIC